METIAWRVEQIPVLALGTAQLGLDYGVANRGGKLSAETVDAVVAEALRQGVRCFDTAQAYGESEARLGANLARHGGAVTIVSKLSPALDPRGARGLRFGAGRSLLVRTALSLRRTVLFLAIRILLARLRLSVTKYPVSSPVSSRLARIRAQAA